MAKTERQARAEARATGKAQRVEAARKAAKAEAKAIREAARAEGVGLEKVTLCHRPDTSDEVAVTVGAPALEAHLTLGDFEGDCVPHACTYLNDPALDARYPAHRVVSLRFLGDEVVDWFTHPSDELFTVTVDGIAYHSLSTSSSRPPWFRYEATAGIKTVSWAIDSGATDSWSVLVASDHRSGLTGAVHEYHRCRLGWLSRPVPHGAGLYSSQGLIRHVGPVPGSRYRPARWLDRAVWRG